MHRVHLVVAGRVQGVGFRDFVKRCAVEQGVGGTVRNLPSGEVEIHAEGTEAALSGFVSAVRTGPVRARVEYLTESWSHGPSMHGNFLIKG